MAKHKHIPFVVLGAHDKMIKKLMEGKDVQGSESRT
jgi:hypothetical protein